MDRELLLLLLGLVVGWPAMVTSALVASAWPGRERASGRDEERRLFRRSVTPLASGIFVTSALLGWAFVEPDDAERAPLALIVVAGLPFLVAARAVVRAVVAAFPLALPPACTVGLLRPRLHIAPSLAKELSSSQLHAVIDHETAHARRHDPLRIAVAQLARDLVWPLPWPGRTLQLWLSALEVARDEEAREAGADPVSLAEALLVCARMLRLGGAARANATVAGAATTTHRLEERIGHLLRPLPAARPPRNGLLTFAVASALALAGAAGALAGEDAVQLLTRHF